MLRVFTLRASIISALTATVALSWAPGLAQADVMVDLPETDSRSSLTDSNSNSSSGWSFSRVEKCLMRKTNDRRASNGRRKLSWDKQLGYVARRHARYMSGNRTVVHDGNLGNKVTRWRALGQNSGSAGGCRRVFRAFWNSSGHRSNLLARWRHMGVGVDRAGGKVWVQHVFERRRDPGNIWNKP
jgi:uncharacterized protein YkwD